MLQNQYPYEFQVKKRGFNQILRLIRAKYIYLRNM